jgi:hypothetical protein
MPARAAEDAGTAAVAVHAERRPGVALNPDSADDAFGVGTEGALVGQRSAGQQGGREDDEGKAGAHQAVSVR